jgi:hypothetical protein
MLEPSPEVLNTETCNMRRQMFGTSVAPQVPLFSEHSLGKTLVPEIFGFFY